MRLPGCRELTAGEVEIGVCVHDSLFLVEGNDTIVTIGMVASSRAVHGAEVGELVNDGESVVLAGALVALLCHVVEVRAVNDRVRSGDSVRKDTLLACAHLITTALVSDIAIVTSSGFLGDGLEARSDVLAGSRVGGPEEVFEDAGVSVQCGFGSFGGEGRGALQCLVDDLLLFGGAGVCLEGSTAGKRSGRTGLGDGDGDLVGPVWQNTRDAGAAGVREWEGAGSGDSVLTSLKVEGIGDIKFSVDGFAVGKGLEILVGECKDVHAALETLEGQRLALFVRQVTRVAR